MRRFLLAAAALTLVLAVFAPTAGAQTRDVTADFTDAGAGPFPRDFFNSDGLKFDRDGVVFVVEGDEALQPRDEDVIAGTFNEPITALSLRLAPDLRGVQAFFTVVTQRFTLDALDSGGGVVDTGSVTVVTDSLANTGFGYVTIDLGSLPSEAISFRLTAEDIGEQPDICSPNCGTSFAVSEVRYTIEESGTDRTPPIVTVPDPITANARSAAGAPVSYEAQATDNADPDPDLSCRPASGSTFPVGKTTVACVATDASGNTAAKSFDIVVNPLPNPSKDNLVGDGAVIGTEHVVVFAQSDPNGSNATGRIDVSGSPYDFEGRVTCLNVVGGRATVGGVILRGEFGTPEEQGFLLVFNDTGGGAAPDQVVTFGGGPDFPAPPSSCPAPATFNSESPLDFLGTLVAHDVKPPPSGRMTGRGSVSGGGLTASYAAIVRCNNAENANAPFEVRFGNDRRFRLSSVSSVACTNDPAVPTGAAGFDTQTGAGAGRVRTGDFGFGDPATIQWKLVDGGAGGARDSVEITIRDAGGAILFHGLAAPPGAFPGGGAGSNTAVGGGGAS
jgi:HYR domain